MFKKKLPSQYGRWIQVLLIDFVLPGGFLRHSSAQSDRFPYHLPRHEREGAQTYDSTPDCAILSK